MESSSSISLLLILFCSAFLLQFRTTLCADDASGDYFRFSCINDGNFTNSSTFGTNLNLLFSQLSTTTKFNYGFYNLSVGQSPDQVNLIGLCRGDQEKEDCRRCLDETVSELVQNCSNFKEAVGWWELCSLQYSSQGIYGIMASSPFTIHTDINNVSDNAKFNQVTNLLLSSLSSRAAAGGSLLKYATDNTTDPGLSERIYGLAQCTPDLSEQDCNECLARAIQRINPKCYGTRGCRVLQPSCNVRYEVRPFFVDVPQLSRLPQSQPAPPSSSTQSSSQTKGIGSKRTPTIIIAIIAVAVVVSILILSLCFWIYSRHKKNLAKKGNNENADSVLLNPAFQDSNQPHEALEERGSQPETALRRPLPRQVEDFSMLKKVLDPPVNSPAKDKVVKAAFLQYDFATVRKSTNNFSRQNKLGQGRFGPVYKGSLPNVQEVAIRRLSSGSIQGDKEFKNEVILMAKLQHRNLVRLLGYCSEGDKRLLIYEFVPNASLDQFLFDPNKSSQLEWGGRYRIIVGIVRGLLYLHDDSCLGIIHLDLKAGNIMLDEDMNPKITDFGMARLFSRDEMRGSANRIVGTHGYMAPEYIMNGQISVKSDIFSFGVLLLEIVSGQENSSLQDEENIGGIISQAWKHWREGTLLNLIDPILKSNVSSTAEMMKCIQIGLLCVQENVADSRPTIASVAGMLSGKSADLPTPSEPRYIMNRPNDAPFAHMLGGNSTSLPTHSEPNAVESVTPQVHGPELKMTKSKLEIIKDEFLEYDFATVQKATNNFNDENELGKGGFGSVYKGRFENGQEVAIKKLSPDSGQGDREFKTEVEILGRLQHRNLVRLLGFCMYRVEKLLIYEFLPNLSLDKFIFDPIKRSELKWERRNIIIGGIARGLFYLHEDSHLRIAHLDLKASNILLDKDMKPKIADFGMAMLFPNDETHISASRIAGTFGYMAPEYVMHRKCTVKTDVFSFGVLLLEIVIGQKNASIRDEESIGGIINHTWKHWREKTTLNLIDPTLRSNGSNTNQMKKYIHIGLLCVQDEADRPTMANVVGMLRDDSLDLPIPKEAALWKSNPRTITPSISSTSHNSVSDMNSAKDGSVSLAEMEGARTGL